MKHFRKFLSLLVIVCLVALGSVVFAAENWENGTITVVGNGVAPARAANMAQARMLAKRAAMVDGYRQLAEIIQGVQVDSESTVENFMAVNDVIRTKVNALVKGARIVGEPRYTPDGGCEVTMVISMYGAKNSLAKAVLTPPPVVKEFPKPAPEVIPSLPADSKSNAMNQTGVLGKTKGSPMAAIGGYTGLIIDCRGLGLRPVMSPVIKNEKNIPIYGHENLNYDLVVKEGMASYAKSQNQAPRAGNRPLVLRAVAVRDNGANPVLSVADANRVLIENGSTGFLNKTAVVFLH